jgi:hypothetical protein
MFGIFRKFGILNFRNKLGILKEIGNFERKAIKKCGFTVPN